MSNKVRRNAAVKTEVSSANIAQIQRTTTTTEQYTGTTMSMTMTMTTTTMKTPLTTTTTTSTSTSTATATTTTTTKTATETEPETSTQETKNAKNSTEATKSGTNMHRIRLMANKWNGESQQPQQHVTNVTTILNNNNNDNAVDDNNNDDDDNDDNDDDDIVNKTNSNDEQQHSYDEEEELKYSYLLQPDEHNLDEYDSNKKLNGNDKFKLLHDEQVERQQQYQQEAEMNDEEQMMEKMEKDEQMDDLEMEKTQCLDYLGDSLETSPLHLCSLKSPGQLVSRLRTLRLRHCCERNVFSALHTIALNATLSGGVECVRILMDIIDLDALATRITCEYAEILFRFDCRQVYSLIHQCHDCKVRFYIKIANLNKKTNQRPSE